MQVIKDILNELREVKELPYTKAQVALKHISLKRSCDKNLDLIIKNIYFLCDYKGKEERNKHIDVVIQILMAKLLEFPIKKSGDC